MSWTEASDTCSLLTAAAQYRHLTPSDVEILLPVDRLEGACCHIVDLLAIYASSTLLLSGVSRRVLVDGESFVDAVFAVAGQG